MNDNRVLAIDGIVFHSVSSQSSHWGAGENHIHHSQSRWGASLRMRVRQTKMSDWKAEGYR